MLNRGFNHAAAGRDHDLVAKGRWKRGQISADKPGGMCPGANIDWGDKLPGCIGRHWCDGEQGVLLQVAYSGQLGLVFGAGSGDCALGPLALFSLARCVGLHGKPPDDTLSDCKAHLNACRIALVTEALDGGRKLLFGIQGEQLQGRGLW